MRVRIWQLLIAILLILPLISLAEDEDLYQVEIILFEDPNSLVNDLENWPIQPPLSQDKQSIELKEEKSSKSVWFYRLLPNSAYRLKDEEASLSKQYRILLHKAWLQPLNAVAKTKSVLLKVDQMKQDSVITLWDNPLLSFQNKKYRIYGVIKLSKRYYINLLINLSLNLPYEEVKQRFKNYPYIQTNKQSYYTFRMLQKRRMRVNELHYIDHPLFGLLVMVTPKKHAQKLKTST